MVTTENLITNPLTAKVGITHQIDDVYVTYDWKNASS
jgi:hypothetical protein